MTLSVKERRKYLSEFICALKNTRHGSGMGKTQGYKTQVELCFMHKAREQCSNTIVNHVYIENQRNMSDISCLHDADLLLITADILSVTWSLTCLDFQFQKYSAFVLFYIISEHLGYVLKHVFTERYLTSEFVLLLSTLCVMHVKNNFL